MPRDGCVALIRGSMGLRFVIVVFPDHILIYYFYIHPYRFYYTCIDIFGIDASFYSILPSEVKVSVILFKSLKMKIIVPKLVKKQHS